MRLLKLAALALLLAACSGTPPQAAAPTPAGDDASTISGPTGNAETGVGGEQVAAQPTESQRTAEEWKSWPVLPSVSDDLRTVYQRGLEAGNNPQAFSILGDCQSLPEDFLGPYDSDPAELAALPAELRETVRNFAGSFNRYSPTVKDGSTAAAILWEQWNDNEEGYCRANETPLECELRVQRPSIVFIHLGTHWETRNYTYLTTIVESLLEANAVPVLVTKADNRELDERVNQDVAALAVEYGLPVWNFWAELRDLPNDGLYPESDWELSEEAKAIHRRSALEALDAVWRGLQ